MKKTTVGCVLLTMLVTSGARADEAAAHNPSSLSVAMGGLATAPMGHGRWLYGAAGVFEANFTLSPKHALLVNVGGGWGRMATMPAEPFALGMSHVGLITAITSKLEINFSASLDLHARREERRWRHEETALGLEVETLYDVTHTYFFFASVTPLYGFVHQPTAEETSGWKMGGMLGAGGNVFFF